ncbi:hypothetical protein [Nocardioides sambongensis]|uniref:hypothetical protein n=1 Tax=Nocardioides sambongensis TaxID=2589074 RepID=UPI0011278515|nr:hypothetical protein [Nocardioides sambongensis]
MSTDRALREALEDGFGAEPPLIPATDHLAHGRRALRRRRVATCLAAGTATAALVAVTWATGAAGPGREAVDRVPAATNPSAEATTDASPGDPARRAQDPQRLVSHRFPAAFDADGGVVVKDGWTVLRRVPNPLGVGAPERSVGLVLSDGERTRWMLVDLLRAPGGGLQASASADGPGKAFAEFDDWLTSMVALTAPESVGGEGGSGGGEGRSDDAGHPLVTEDARGDLVAVDGVRLLAVRDADPIPGYTQQGDRYAKVERDGEIWFAVVRGTGPSMQVIPVDAATLPAPTWAALTEHLRAGTDSGEGML